MDLMNNLLIKIAPKLPDDSWQSEVITPLSNLPGVELYVPADMRYRSQTLGTAKEIIIALSSAGAFTAFFQFLRSYLERDKHRELTLQRDKIKLTIKGHSHNSEAEVLEQLIGVSNGAPPLSPSVNPPRPSPSKEEAATKPRARKK